jgi:hypothetical protein
MAAAIRIWLKNVNVTIYRFQYSQRMTCTGRIPRASFSASPVQIRLSNPVKCSDFDFRP